MQSENRPVGGFFQRFKCHLGLEGVWNSFTVRCFDSGLLCDLTQKQRDTGCPLMAGQSLNQRCDPKQNILKTTGHIDRNFVADLHGRQRLIFNDFADHVTFCPMLPSSQNFPFLFYICVKKLKPCFR